MHSNYVLRQVVAVLDVISHFNTDGGMICRITHKHTGYSFVQHFGRGFGLELDDLKQWILVPRMYKNAFLLVMMNFWVKNNSSL
jgi:hypothetical protein